MRLLIPFPANGLQNLPSSAEKLPVGEKTLYKNFPDPHQRGRSKKRCALPLFEVLHSVIFNHGEWPERDFMQLEAATPTLRPQCLRPRLRCAHPSAESITLLKNPDPCSPSPGPIRAGDVRAWPAVSILLWRRVMGAVFEMAWR